MKNRGAMATTIAIKLFGYLESYHIPTLFISQYGDREILIRNAKSIPLEVVVHNYADEEYGKRAGIKAGTKLEIPLTELYSVDDNAEKKELTESDLIEQGLLSVDEARMIKRILMKLNALLIAYFNRRNLILVDYVVKFGKQKGQVVLNNEILPENCTLNDKGESDFSSFSIQDRYHEIFNRLVG